jgi:hypothetical protein
MRWPRVLAVAIPAVIAAVLSSPPADAKRIGTYSAKDVKHGFAAVGDPVFDTGYSSFASPVTVLSTISPRDGWTATIYLYPSVAKAVASYEANGGQWRQEGIAAEQRRNLVVTVSRGTKQASTREKPAVPALVVKALSLAARRQR